MQYEVRTAAIEAERVSLSGQNLYAVAVEGKAHLVPGEVFDLFFALRDAVAGMKAAVKPCPVKAIVNPIAKALMDGPKPPKKASKPATLKGGPQARSAELRSLCLKALQECGGLTTAELGDRMYPGVTNAKHRFQGAWAALRKMKEDGLIEKDEDTLQWQLKTK